MRKIKFRGKHHTKGYWVYGGVLAYQFSAYIIGEDSERYEIDPITLGQFTGLQDRNGTDIYEGDILGDVKFPKATPLICEFRHGAFGYEYCGDFHPWGGNTNFTFNPFDKDSRFEITGNVHDKNS